jgi:hypothetical protein
MAYFPHAFKKMLVATNATPFPTAPVPATTLDLAAGQLAIVDSKTNLPVDLTASPTYGATGAANEFSQVYLAQGSFYTNDKIGPFHGGYQETVKSKGINPKYISKFYRTDPADAVNEIVDICTNSCEIACDTVYDLRIDIKGSPTLRFLTHNLYQTLSYKTPCCDDANNPIDPMLVLLGWADQINGTGSGNATVPFLNQFIQAVVWFEETTTTTTADPAGGNTLTLTAIDDFDAGDRVLFNGEVYYVDPAHVSGTGAGTVDVVDLQGNAVVLPAVSIGADVTVYDAVTSDTYTPTVGAGASAVNGCLQIIGAYVDTVFGDCSFNPKDHFEKEPIKIYASAASYANNSNDLGDNRCEVSCFDINTAQLAVQGKGYGETLVRELILVKGYRQENWYDDPRMREVTLDTVLGSSGGTPEILRSGSYVVYHLLHSVPRKSNPDGTFDNDQYLVKIVADAADLNFENWMNDWLVSANNAVQLEVVA